MERKKIAFVVRNDNRSESICSVLKEYLLDELFVIDSQKPDIIIAIGGDGTFLSAFRKYKLCKDAIYIGVNTGTLGFLQEVLPENIHHIVEALKLDKIETKDLYTIDIEVTLNDSRVLHYSAINEIELKEYKNGRVHCMEYVGSDFLQEVCSDSIIIYSSTGATGKAKSYGAAIFADEIPLLGCIILGAQKSISNGDFIQNTLISQNFFFEMKGDRNNFTVNIDGRQIDEFDCNDILNINVKSDSQKIIKVISINGVNRIKKINQKILGYN